MKKISHYAALMRRLAHQFNYNPCDCQVRCFEKQTRNSDLRYLPDIGRLIPVGGMEVKGIHGGRQAFESVFTWTTIALDRGLTAGNDNIIRLVASYHDALRLIGLSRPTIHELALIIAFEKHCPVQCGRFNSIFVGMPGMYLKEYDQAYEAAHQIVNGSRFLNGSLPELGSKDRSGIMSAVIKLYTNQCSKIEGDLPDDQLVEWHEWAQAYIVANNDDRKHMRLKRFQPYGWWNEQL